MSVMARKLKSDRPLFLTTVALVAASIVMVYSASNVLAMDRYQQPNLFLIKQALFAVLGLAAMAIAMRIDYQLYRHPRVIWTVLGVTLLTLVAVLLVGPKINGTRRWFALGGIGIQPSELAKIAMILFTAGVLERRMDRINDVEVRPRPDRAGARRHPRPDSAAAGLRQRDGRARDRGGDDLRRRAVGTGYFVGIAASLVPLVGLVAIVAPYRLRRLMAFWDPWEDQRGDGFQVVQSLIAVGTGGVTGRGLGQSVQKLFYLPEPHTDFIYAVVAEELGLIGATLVLVELLHHHLARPAHRRAGAGRLRIASWPSASPR